MIPTNREKTNPTSPMIPTNLALADSLISTQQAGDSLSSHQSLVRTLITHRRLPKQGWDDASIELFLAEIALMDSNNFAGAVGFGEREARIHSAIVRKRHFGLGHGMGRSGDVAAEQPKVRHWLWTHHSQAAGSSLLVKLTHGMALDAIRLGGVRKAEAAVVLPLATGMTLTVCFLVLKSRMPHRDIVLVTRMDQKSGLKAVAAAGLVPIVVENLLKGDEVMTDLTAVVAALDKHGERVLCVLTTTSCFAPRAPDRVIDIAKLCAERNIAHLVNHAYGIQSSKCSNLLNDACAAGRVDAFVSSTDKNFLVPVGGAVVASPGKEFVDEVSKIYPGRASSSPVVDLFITLLSLGSNGYLALLNERKRTFEMLRTELTALCARHDCLRLLHTPHNDISMGVSVPSDRATEFGSMLFTRRVSGTRVVAPHTPKTVAGIEFASYGAHIDGYPTAYITVSQSPHHSFTNQAAAAVGLSPADIPSFVSRFESAFKAWRK